MLQLLLLTIEMALTLGQPRAGQALEWYLNSFILLLGVWLNDIACLPFWESAGRLRGTDSLAPGREGVGVGAQPCLFNSTCYLTFGIVWYRIQPQASLRTSPSEEFPAAFSSSFFDLIHQMYFASREHHVASRRRMFILLPWFSFWHKFPWRHTEK